jgi:hypothetical protein
MRLPVGDSDDGSNVVNHTALTQPPPSKKVHALDRLTSGTKRIPSQERCSELTEMRALLRGSKKSVLRSPFIIITHPEGRLIRFSFPPRCLFY